MHVYNEDFYEYQSKGSFLSAQVIIDILKDYIELESVLDVGCGVGTWLKVYESKGAKVTGLDGEYVNANQLLIKSEDFIGTDLKNEVNLTKQFSLAQSLEVAEHIPENCANNFAKTLTNHSDCVLFSAAVPGQGGEDHINEQPLEYWRKKFAADGYAAFDLVRPLLEKRPDKDQVEKWYRYNTVLYIKKSSPLYSQASLQAYKVDEQARLKTFSDPMWTLRKLIVRALPNSISTLIARVRAKHIANSMKKTSG